MARATRFAAIASIATVLYVLALASILPVPFVDEDILNKIIPAIPWWVLVSFGSYSLYSLGSGLFAFREAEEAYTELLGEIDEAKNELRGKGISVD